nr:protein GrpE-like isoform X1 [Ipomoea batatas]
MATAVLRTAAVLRAPPSASLSATVSSSALLHKVSSPVSITRNGRRMRTSSFLPIQCRIDHRPPNLAIRPPRSRSVVQFVLSASDGEATETAQTETEEYVRDSELEENIGGAHDDADTSNEVENASVEESQETASTLMNVLQSYREALANNDGSKVAEVETYLKSIEDEKINLEREILTLTQLISSEKACVLRISTDFASFRKRTEREWLSLVTTAQGEVIEKLLPMLDSFERAKAQIKVGSEGEEKISNSYQSIYKQFVEILSSLGVTPVETTANPANPLLYEAIMHKDSVEFKEGVIIAELHKGFKLGDRLCGVNGEGICRSWTCKTRDITA